MITLAIDPGTTHSAWVKWDGRQVVEFALCENSRLIAELQRTNTAAYDLVIEEIRCYGMAVGKEVLDTVFVSGRFAQAWDERGGWFYLVPRLDVKMHHCHTARASDANIYQALKDRFGAPGTKARPGTLHGMNQHHRAALALAVYWHDKEGTS